MALAGGDAGTYSGRDLFVSHHSDNRRLAEQIHAALTGRGFSVWLDSEDIAPGMQWAERLESALPSCRAFGLIATHQSIASRFVRTEYAAALELAHQPGRQLQLIALRFDDVELPLLLRTFQYVDFRTAGFEKSIDELCRGLSASRAEGQYPPAPVDRSSQDVEIKLRYVDRELSREHDTIRQLTAARRASVATGVLAASALIRSGIAVSAVTAVWAAVAAILTLTALGWMVTFRRIDQAKSQIAKLEVLRDGLSGCTGRVAGTCLEWHAHFWRVLSDGPGTGQ